MIKALLSMGLTGSVVVLAWQLTAWLDRGRFSAQWHYGVLKLGVCAFLFPFGSLLWAVRCAVTPDTPSIPSQILEPAGFSQAGAGLAQGTPVLTPGTAPVLPEPSGLAEAAVSAEAAGLLAVVWLAGAAALLAYKLWRFYRFRQRILKQNTAVDDLEILALLRDCQRRTGFCGSVALERSGYLQTALVTGLFRPKLVLPDRELSQEELRCILQHELTHIKNGDLWTRCFALLAVCLHWWNPWAHLLERKIQEVGEYCCDGQVAAPMSRKERYEYGKVILKVVSDTSSGLEEWAAPFSAKQSIERRLSVMLNTKKMSKKGKALAVGAASLILVCGTAAAVSAQRLLPEPAQKPESEAVQKVDSPRQDEDSQGASIAYTVPKSDASVEQDVDVPPPEQEEPGQPVQSAQPQESSAAGSVPEAEETKVLSLEEQLANLTPDHVWRLPEEEELYQAYLRNHDLQTLPQEMLGQLENGAYPRNSKGETYGSELLKNVAGGDPDLISAIGTNGEHGYVRESDMGYYNVHNPDEALAYMEEMKKYPNGYDIPLYDSEGNVIGVFRMSTGGEPVDLPRDESGHVLKEYLAEQTEDTGFDEGDLL